jgi:hypothetical protein
LNHEDGVGDPKQNPERLRVRNINRIESLVVLSRNFYIS